MRAWLTLLIACLLVLVVGRVEAGEDLKFTMIDIIKAGGWGDSFFLKTPAGKTILIDTGIGRPVTNSVIPYLEKNLSGKDAQLDVLVLSHAHGDHFSGIKSIADRFKIGSFVGPSNTPGDILKKLSDKKVPITVPKLGDTFDWGGGVVATAINVYDPEKNGLEDDGQKGRNNNSIVLKVVYGKTSVLLTGDLEIEGEKLISTRSYDLKSDVLKCGHHGVENRREDSSGYDFLMRVNPKIVLISGGGSLLKPWVMEKFHILGADIFVSGSERIPVELISDGKVWTKPVHRTPEPYQPGTSNRATSFDNIELYGPDDKLHFREHWNEGKLEGLYEICNKEGEVGQFWYKNGLREGPGYFFRSDGSLWGESYAENGKITQSWIYFSRGKIWKTSTTDEKGNTCTREFDESGKLIAQDGPDISPKLTAPSFLERPMDQTVFPGQSAKFLAKVAGVPYPDIKWYENDQLVEGATSPVFTTRVLKESDHEIKYSVTISNEAGEAKSEVKVLIDSNSKMIKPSILSEPKSRKVEEGEMASFSVNAKGMPLEYQWQKKIGSKDWADIPQGTNQTYTVQTKNLKADGTKYRVVISNPVGRVTSREASLDFSSSKSH